MRAVFSHITLINILDYLKPWVSLASLTGKGLCDLPKDIVAGQGDLKLPPGLFDPAFILLSEFPCR